MPPSSVSLIRILAAFTMFFIAVEGAHAQTIIRELAYGPKERNQLDLFLPEQSQGAPIVVFIHGGRWLRGDKSQVEEYARVDALNRAGIAVASINHTYSTEAPWPAQLNDALVAVAWLQSHAETYGFDPSRLGLWGQSSGGHVVLMTAATLAADHNSALKAVAAWFPPSDLAQLPIDRLNDSVPDNGDGGVEPLPESLLIGAPVSENRVAADNASPVTVFGKLALDATAPPILLVHGTDDFIVSPFQTQRLCDVLSGRKGQVVSLLWVQGGGHGRDGFQAATAPSVEFFADLLKVPNER